MRILRIPSKKLLGYCTIFIRTRTYRGVFKFALVYLIRVKISCKLLKDELESHGKQKRLSLQKQPPEVLYKKVFFLGVLFYFFLNKVVPATFLRKRFRHRFFPVGFAKLLRIPFLQNIFGELLQNFKEWFWDVCMSRISWVNC